MRPQVCRGIVRKSFAIVIVAVWVGIVSMSAVGGGSSLLARERDERYGVVPPPPLCFNRKYVNRSYNRSYLPHEDLCTLYGW